MTRIQAAFLQLMQNVLCGSSFGDEYKLTEQEWQNILQLSDEQKVLPLVLETASKTIKPGDKKFLSFRGKAYITVTRQIIQTNEFLTLLLHAQSQGLDPIVLKGIICRELYEKPFLRLSVDEDLLVSPEQLEAFHCFLLNEGLYSDNPVEDDTRQVAATTELSYHKENSPTYIELQKTIFDPDSAVFGRFNELFPNLSDHTMRVQIEDVSVCTLESGYHLLYLILHVFKHFVYSGVGIRPLCDIGLFAQHYADEIDWNWLRDSLEKVGVFYYARALFRIIQLHLMPNAPFYDRIEDWELSAVDVEPLLEDMLASGLHGASSMMRLHSSNMTLEAVKAKRLRKRSVLSTVFPPLTNMRSRYPYLKKAPFLLPVAWAQRILHYLKETHRSSRGTVSESAESIRLGRERVKLLEKYHII